MWAVVLGVFLLLVAALSADAASAATRLGDRTLKIGMEGRDVRHLQMRLSTAGFFDAAATARFGRQTRTAVRRYQRSRCLTADGIAGAATIRALRTLKKPCRAAAGAGAGTEKEQVARGDYLEVQLGERTLARDMAGRDVRTVQRLLKLRSTGTYGPETEAAVRDFQRDAGLGVDGAVGPATRDALVDRRMKPRTATYYGPGLYGNRTACGQRLTTKLRGVAHRSLPCGTPVTLFYEGRFVLTEVVDRGPFVDGITFDLTSATARELGQLATVRLRAGY
jgi:peptidoglycan hydrolase-like protein with peptidoglycan-binding domain